MASHNRGASTQEVLSITAIVSIAAIAALTAFSADVRTTVGCFGEKLKATKGQPAVCAQKPTPKKT